MAIFAKLDENNVVKTVVVVGDDIPTVAGPLGDNDMHVDGETWCVNFFKGGTWKQTSIDNNFRKQYAAIGGTYDPAKDKFIQIPPGASWSLDSNDDWQPPIAYPPPSATMIDEDTFWVIEDWDESAYQADNTKGWKASKSNDSANPPTMYDWNGSSWVAV